MINRLIFLPVTLFILVILSACASTAPVQEMSNARQTIAAAHEARAKQFAPSQLAEAESLMDQATGALEQGDYVSARQFAVAAQQRAIKARQFAISQQNN